MLRRTIFLACLIFAGESANAQQGYEFEVYKPEIGAIGSTELELSSNYVAQGIKTDDEGLYPTHHAVRSSLELTRAFSSWLQGSAYLTANARPGHSLAYVGNRIKVTTVAPASWSLPFELGLANELSYARAGFAEHLWTYELTPILSKRVGPLDFVVNPAFERGVSGSEEHHIDMEPRASIGHSFDEEESISLEYYAGLGGIGEHYSVSDQTHQIFAKFQGEFAEKLEFAIGLGRGLTKSSDRWVITTAFEYKLGGN